MLPSWLRILPTVTEGHSCRAHIRGTDMCLKGSEHEILCYFLVIGTSPRSQQANPTQPIPRAIVQIVCLKGSEHEILCSFFIYSKESFSRHSRPPLQSPHPVVQIVCLKGSEHEILSSFPVSGSSPRSEQATSTKPTSHCPDSLFKGYCSKRLFGPLFCKDSHSGHSSHSRLCVS